MAERTQQRRPARQTPPPADSGAPDAAHEIVTFSPTGQPTRRILRDGEWYYAVDDALAPLLPHEGAWDEVIARLRVDGARQIEARIFEESLIGTDGVVRPTRVASASTLLRLLEAVVGPEAESARGWLVRVGSERLREEEDPAIAVERARKLYARQGYPRDWTQRRLHGITLRQRLAQEWAARGAREGADYAALTDALSQGVFGLTVEAYKAAKRLKASQSLRDSMTSMELLLMNLVEETALTLSQARDSQGVEALLRDAQEASAIGAATRRGIESRLGRSLLTPANYRALRQGQAPRRASVYLGPPLAAPPTSETPPLTEPQAEPQASDASVS